MIAKRNLRYPLLDIFDLPDMHNSCPRRSATTTAPQALALLNSDFTLALAQQWSGQLLIEYPADLESLTRAAMTQSFGRPPSAKQLRLASEFLAHQTAAIAAAGDASASDILPTPLAEGANLAAAAAVVDFCHALLNSNEFLYLD